MNFTSLHYFLVTAEEMNITKAASRLHISQQALSGHIQKLEKELHITLFERSPALTLTYAGKKLRGFVYQIMDLEHQMFQTAGDISNDLHGEVRIGISHTCGRAILPDILPLFRLSHPGINIQLFEGNSSELEESLRAGNLDLIIAFAPFMLEGIKSVRLIEEHLFLVIPKELMRERFGEKYRSVIDESRKSFDFSVFADMPFIMLKQGNRARTLVDSLMKSTGFTPNIILETENTETAYALAQKGMGIAVYPELFHLCITHPEDEYDSVEFLPLPDSATSKLEVGWISDRYQTRAAKDFVQLCTKALGEIKARQESGKIG